MKKLGAILVCLAALLIAGCEGEKAIDTTNRPKPGGPTAAPAEGTPSAAPPMRGTPPAGQAPGGN